MCKHMNLAKHKKHAIVSLPNLTNDFYFQAGDDKKIKYKYSHKVREKGNGEKGCYIWFDDNDSNKIE